MQRSTSEECCRCKNGRRVFIILARALSCLSFQHLTNYEIISFARSAATHTLCARYLLIIQCPPPLPPIYLWIRTGSGQLRFNAIPARFTWLPRIFSQARKAICNTKYLCGYTSISFLFVLFNPLLYIIYSPVSTTSDELIRRQFSTLFSSELKQI